MTHKITQKKINRFISKFFFYTYFKSPCINNNNISVSILNWYFKNRIQFLVYNASSTATQLCLKQVKNQMKSCLPFVRLLKVYPIVNTRLSESYLTGCYPSRIHFNLTNTQSLHNNVNFIFLLSKSL